MRFVLPGVGVCSRVCTTVGHKETNDCNLLFMHNSLEIEMLLLRLHDVTHRHVVLATSKL